MAEAAPYMKVEFGKGGDMTSQVWSVDVEDVDRGCDKATLMVADFGSSNAEACREGVDIKINLGWDKEYAFVFEGRICGNYSAARGKEQVKLVAYDFSQRLAVGKQPPSRLYVGTLAAILDEIFAKRHQIPLGKVDIDPMPSWTEDQPLLQHNENDWRFVQHLAETYRARVFVEINVKEGDPPKERAKGGVSRYYFISEEKLLEQEPLGTLKYCRGWAPLIEFDYQRVASGASPSLSATVSSPETGDSKALEGPPPVEEPPTTCSPERTKEISEVKGEAAAQAVESACQESAKAETKPEDLRPTKNAIGLPSSEELAERNIKPDRTRILGFHGKGTAIGSVFIRAKGSVEIEGLASWAQGRWYLKRVNHVVQRVGVGNDTQLTYRTKFEATR